MRHLCLLIVCVPLVVAADYQSVDPNAFPKDDPRGKALARMVSEDSKKRLRDANLRESRAFAELTTKAEWERYRDARIAKLKESLGMWTDAPKDTRVFVTRTFDGDGYVIQCVVYESRPGFWVVANLYLPAKPPEKMPGIIIAHAHHGGKTGGELQDMGMTWARSGVAVLVPDQIGYGERREHEFNTEKDYDKPFRVSRQDYYFRYNSNLQLSAVGESLMGWMAWDLMRGVDVLLKQKTIDKDRVILLGSVAGGGDPAGVTAALDNRIACVVPFNFGGWQPESSVLENPDRDFAWFGDGYWESTRGLKNGARDGFAHFVIVGSVAPRKLIHAHEFAWDAMKDPAWPRLRKIFGFQGAEDSLKVAHGTGSLQGRPPESSHCNHIGAVHRKMIHLALRDWFAMPVPEEYSKNRPSAELRCWTEAARSELKPRKLREVVAEIARARSAARVKASAGQNTEAALELERKAWAARLGNIEPNPTPKGIDGKSEAVDGGTLTRHGLEVEPGIVVPLLLITPKDAKGRIPAVVLVAQGGKAGFLRERGDAVAEFLKAGMAVCLVDVRGTGETRAGASADRGSARTSVSQVNLILGQPVLGSQLRDLRTVVRWLQARDGIDGKKLALWGDSFAKPNPADIRVAVPLDLETPSVSEPGGANLAVLAALFEDGIAAVYARGGIDSADTLTGSPYLYLPHEAVVPGPVQAWAIAPALGKYRPVAYEATVDAQNRARGGTPMAASDAAKWLVNRLRAMESP